MATIQKQVRMVFDLNKCIGCHTCSMACKTMWTDRNDGLMYMYWNNVETRPGKGYPKGFEDAASGAGFPDGNPYLTSDAMKKVLTDNPLRPIVSHYGAAWEYNYSEVLKVEGGNASSQMLVPSPEPNGPDAYASNWDEDVGREQMPNNYYFYVPRICNHCTKPGCVAACPRKAAYKREEDGVVLIDQDRCRGYRYCVKGCPYKKSYYNPREKISQKCIFCYPRLEDPKGFPTGRHSFCFTQCTGRIRYAGFFQPASATSDNFEAEHRDLLSGARSLSEFNARFNVNRLLYEYKVALRLRPEFGTQPNLFYVPPLSPPKLSSSGSVSSEQRVPIGLLAELFGDYAGQSYSERIARVGEIFEKIEDARAGRNPGLLRILIARTEQDRLQLDLGFAA
ncbi:MAG TPA: 4Fe-4S dicluster domain-containing protein [Anaeromyxobacter sp.]|nr:4Fe-4S dicluster domain-containing protein [Anaeromyxobacter sp.]